MKINYANKKVIGNEYIINCNGKKKSLKRDIFIKKL